MHLHQEIELIVGFTPPADHPKLGIGRSPSRVWLALGQEPRLSPRQGPLFAEETGVRKTGIVEAAVSTNAA